MARKPRIYSEKGIYHVILRGNNQQDIFHSDKDKEYLLKKLEKYSNELNIEIYAYSLMPNHIHLLIGNAYKTISLFVQKLANSYVYYFNRKYERSGHLFQGRFKSEPILDDEYFKTVYRYILQNSENAGISTLQSDEWNSFKHLTKQKKNTFINSTFVINLFDSKQNIIDFILLKKNDNCMEYNPKLALSDESALRLLKKLLHVHTPYELERMHISEQQKNCLILKDNGLSISQISRITGLSRSIIKSA